LGWSDDKLQITGNRIQIVSGADVYNKYLQHVPAKLKPPTSAKARLALFEEINEHLYDQHARMVAFCFTQDKIFIWIKALMIFNMENSAFPNDYAIFWLYEPDDWSANENKSVVIEISKKTSVDTAAFLIYKITLFLSTGTYKIKLFLSTGTYKITLFLSTGTFWIKGNYKDKFTVNDFHSLKALVIRIADFSKNFELM
jgi:hypothetical protein